MPQVQLPIFPQGVTPITSEIAFQCEEGKVCYFNGQLELDQFFSQRLAPIRKGTRWDLILKTLVCYRLLDPGSEWRLHRQWFVSSAMADLLGSDFSLAESHKLYRIHELLLAHKAELFSLSQS
jgi:hypothetical protein